MTPVVETLARLVEEVSGNVIPAGSFRFLEVIGGRRARARGLSSLDSYVRALEAGELAREWRELLPLITIKESYLFRSPQQFRVIADTIVPLLVHARAGRRSLSVWSAGCACGEEPATLAIVLSEAPALSGWDWRIVATDVDEEALAAARQGLYGDRAVSQVPPELLRRYFTRRNTQYELSPRLLERIDYRPLNLIQTPLDVAGSPFDIVMLRNVLIYFKPESQRRVAAGVLGHTAPDGVLFLGPAETLWQVYGEAEPTDAGDCFYYRRRSPGSPPPPLPRPTETPPRRPTPERTSRPAAPAVHRPGSTVHAEGTAPVRAAPPDPDRRPSPSSPPPTPSGNAARLAEAARLLAAGQLEGAEERVGSALELDPADSLAHALEGLTHDLAGRPPAAIAAYRAALFLDADLFQVRFLLAESLRRTGWDHRARQEYRRVLATIEGSSPRALSGVDDLQLPEGDEIRRRIRRVLAAD